MEQINRLEKEIADLRRTLEDKELELSRIKNEWLPEQHAEVQAINITDQNQCDGKQTLQIGDKLPKWAIERYSRQIILPDIGVEGQKKLCAARVLIVGAGGLGCPAGAYLAGAGIGEIGIVDYDTVDLTNIHRQFLHFERDQFCSKAESAANKLRSINRRIKVTVHNTQLDSSNSLQLLSQYDVVVDCSDNVPTRYLLNDSCILAKVPLISGSALKMEGQLTIYGYRGDNTTNDKPHIGPCYRCVFPTPPPPDTVGSCSANGVAGPVPGTIGALQALEAIKYIVGNDHTKLLVERMLIFDGEDLTIRTVKLRPRNPSCALCSDSPTITRLLDYEVFCQTQAKEKQKQDTHLKSELRKHEKLKRMSGQSYYGFRITNTPNKKWIQDVPKEGRKIGPPCPADICTKSRQKKCSIFEKVKREEIFMHFWNELDWKGKRGYVRSLVDVVPVKRRRIKHKGEDLDLKILSPEHRISPEQLSNILRNSNKRHLLVDVRSEPEFNMCNIDGSVNYPIEKLNGDKLEAFIEEIRKSDQQVIFICRRGNDSQLATQRVLTALSQEHRDRITDLEGGLHNWAGSYDPGFPVY